MWLLFALALTVPDSLVRRVAEAESIPTRLASRLVHHESQHRPCVINRTSGATGLTQLLLSTARSLEPGITRKALCEPERNLRLGFRYLRSFQRRYGSWGAALVCFRFGEGGYLERRKRRGWSPHTEPYVRKILHTERRGS